MAEPILPDYDSFDFFLHQNELPCTAAEIHGIICGCLAGGMPFQSGQWRKFVSEFALQEAELTDEVASKMQEIYKATYEQLLDPDFVFDVYIPRTEDIPLAEQAQMLIEWLAAFISSFGATVGERFANVDKEVREAYQDLIAISQMDTEMEESEENLIAFEEVAEYIRMTTIMCFSELGDKSGVQAAEPGAKPTLH
ncbi:UPF0149 family protein [Catenovulum agarivorans]|uniref:UPF0149 family protein n=1 Tax=Catenovulum agarivorans TaxID=1172192 RepID=UPI0002DA04AB|nr:UPF0149 family protein [Catenovulum agarivorans]